MKLSLPRCFPAALLWHLCSQSLRLLTLQRIVSLDQGVIGNGHVPAAGSTITVFRRCAFTWQVTNTSASNLFNFNTATDKLPIGFLLTPARAGRMATR